jgi:hypothetical protein
MLIPYSSRRNLSADEEILNRAITTTRSTVERAIGYWKCRFRSMHSSGGDLCYDPAKACRLIVASVVLSNFCKDKGFMLQDDDRDFMNNVLIPELQLD